MAISPLIFPPLVSPLKPPRGGAHGVAHALRSHLRARVGRGHFRVAAHDALLVAGGLVLQHMQVGKGSAGGLVPWAAGGLEPWAAL